MKLYLRGHDYKYACEQMLLMLFPAERPEYPDGKPEGERCELRLSRGEKMVTATCRLYLGGERFGGRAVFLNAAITDALTDTRLSQRAIKLAFYRAAILAKGDEPRPVWGALTGIRPGKLMAQLLESGLSDRAALSRFCADYDVSRGRAGLCQETAKAGLEVKASLLPRDVCLYVGIPFCPTRCAYCSFVSQSVEKSFGLIEPFLQALYQDIDATARTARSLGLRVISIYIGGGTPTTLSAAQLEALCSRISAAFDLSALREYTVEAGRPDTVTVEKLRVLKEHGVTRVSINPQSMRDNVLEAIGRRHTAEDVIKAAAMVRELGGIQINTDLIAGLPADTVSGFSETLDAVLALDPENITVHTLSLKKGSRITLEGTALPSARDVGAMLDLAQPRLEARAYAPYYLYRQKFMSGGFENVSWSKKGCENLYNVCIMEELNTVLAVGGGASTKLVSPSGRIERVFAPKYPLEYIENIDKVTGNKIKIKEFYATHCSK